MKRTIFLICALLVSALAQSQILKFGATANAGINNTFVIVDNSLKRSYYYKYDDDIKYYKIYYTYNFGLNAELTVLNRINFETQLLFSQKTANCKIGIVFQNPDLNTIVKYNYISLPASVSYNFVDFFALNIGFVNNFAISYQPNNIFNDQSYHKKFYSASLLLGININVSKKMQIKLDATNDRSPSLVDKINKDYIGIYNQTLMFGVKYYITN